MDNKPWGGSFGSLSSLQHADDSTQRGCDKKGNWLPLARFPKFLSSDSRTWPEYRKSSAGENAFWVNIREMVASSLQKETYSFRIARLNEALKELKKERYPDQKNKRKTWARARDRTGDLAQSMLGWTLSANHTTRPPGQMYERVGSFCQHVSKGSLLQLFDSMNA